MTLKRKRSEPELCSSPLSSSSLFSSPPENTSMDVNPIAFYNMPPAHLHSRTRKRYRDNRPSEAQVHQHTLNLLYSAQQQPKHTPRDTSQPEEQTAITAQPSKQQSLHHFWTIRSAPTTQIHSHQPLLPAPCACEDCGGSMSNTGDESMDIDDLTNGNTACGACGKHVCFSCSISNLGEEKRCLQCAGRRAWDGGAGWTNAGMPVC